MLDESKFVKSRTQLLAQVDLKGKNEPIDIKKEFRKDAVMKKLRKTLTKGAEERKSEELEEVMKYLEHVDYFKARKLRGKDLKDVCKGMDYIKKSPHSYVIKWGEEGDRFYIILRGEVGVWLPIQMKDM